jgi:hypothetical protein
MDYPHFLAALQFRNTMPARWEIALPIGWHPVHGSRYTYCVDSAIGCFLPQTRGYFDTSLIFSHTDAGRLLSRRLHLRGYPFSCGVVRLWGMMFQVRPRAR